MPAVFPIFSSEPARYVITARFIGNYGTGTPSASTTRDLGAEYKIKFISGSVSGGSGAAAVSSGGLTQSMGMTGSLAIGRIECRNAANSIVATIGLPLYTPLIVDNVRYITITVEQSTWAASERPAFGTTMSGSGIASAVFEVI